MNGYPLRTRYQHFYNMKQPIIDLLRSLAVSDEERPPAARLLDFIDEIEAALAAGVRQATIRDALQKHGLHISETAFRGILFRYRKRKKRAQSPDPPPLIKATQNTNLQSPHRDKTGAYKNDLSPEERLHIASLSPSEKVAFFREKYQQQRFTHNPTPTRFRKEGD